MIAENLTDDAYQWRWGALGQFFLSANDGVGR
jgi:hypothetical protein